MPGKRILLLLASVVASSAINFDELDHDGAQMYNQQHRRHAVKQSLDSDMMRDSVIRRAQNPSREDPFAEKQQLHQQPHQDELRPKRVLEHETYPNAERYGHKRVQFRRDEDSPVEVRNPKEQRADALRKAKEILRMPEHNHVAPKHDGIHVGNVDPGLRDFPEGAGVKRLASNLNSDHHDDHSIGRDTAVKQEGGQFAKLKDTDSSHAAHQNIKVLKDLKNVNVQYAKVAVKAEEPEENGPIEVLCTVGFKESAEIHWTVNGNPLEAFVDHVQSTTIKDDMPARVSKLTVDQLERIPTETGKYLFECSAIVDGQLTKATITVGSTIEDKCKGNDECESRGALCVDNMCTCRANQPVSLKSRHVTCRPASQLGWPCTYSEQCSFAVPNSACSKALRCECSSGFQKTADGKLCTRISGTYCASNTDCEFLKGTCENNMCACSNETSLRMGLCVKPGTPALHSDVVVHVGKVMDNNATGGDAKGGSNHRFALDLLVLLSSFTLLAFLNSH